MTDVFESFRELSSGVKLLVALGVGLFVLVPILVVVSAVVGAFVLSVGGSAGAAGPPQVQFAASYHESAGELTVTHEAGESFESSSVVVEVDGQRRAWPGSGTVTEGDSVTLSGVEPGDTVRVVWRGGSGESMVLFRYEV